MPSITNVITRIVLTLLVCALSLPASANPNRDGTTNRMNVVFILIDDLGWNDLGCYGSQYYRTPNIDRLAAESVRFTDAYAACTVCSPTRAAILTGKYPARLLLTQWLPSGRWNPQRNRLREARYLSNLPLEEVTIAEALRESGYRTGFIGKWHLGTQPYYYPEHQGFEVNIAGRDYGAPGSYFFPFEGTWSIPTTGKRLFKESPLAGKDGDYLVDRLAEEAEQFIRDNKNTPFFLMLSHYAVHAPLQAKADMVAYYETVPTDERQGDPRYAAMVESVDDSVGRVLRTLKELGIDKRTLVIFTSDNGGYARATSNAPLRANKGSNFEGGIRVPLIVKWPGRGEPGSVSHQPVISMDFYPSILAATGLPARPEQHLDGLNLESALSGSHLDRDAIFWHYPHYNQHPQSFPCGVIRSEDWKLIEAFETGEVSLFNLADDIGEKVDLADQKPEKASELRLRLQRWRSEVGADPMRPNKEYREPSSKTIGGQEMNPPPNPLVHQTIALVGGRLIDGRGHPPLEDSIVVVRGNRIVAAGSRDQVVLPPDAITNDVSGMSVLPGLIDSHFHSRNNVKTPVEYELRNGITSFRDPGHPFRFYSAVLQSKQAMPRVFLCGGHLDAAPAVWQDQAVVITDVENARRAVHQHVDRGASAIKVYFRLPLEHIRAACAAARERNVIVTAHLELVDAVSAIHAGVRGIEHVTSFGTSLADSKQSEHFVSAIEADSNARRQWRYRLWASLDLTHSAGTQPVIETVVKHGVFVSPTLAVFERRAGQENTTDVQARAFENMLHFVGLCHEAGAKVVVGSHTSAPFAQRGQAYQRELELLVEAGLSPLEAISAGTLHNAQFFGIERRLGSIQSGKTADLILVEGDPSKDIGAMKHVRRVMLNGNWVAENQ